MVNEILYRAFDQQTAVQLLNLRNCEGQFITSIQYPRFIYTSLSCINFLIIMWRPAPIRLHSSIGRASHRYRGGHGFESRWSPDFFQGYLWSCLICYITAKVISSPVFIIRGSYIHEQFSMYLSFYQLYTDAAYASLLASFHLLVIFSIIHWRSLY